MKRRLGPRRVLRGRLGLHGAVLRRLGLTLIGYVTRVQAELQFRSPEPCDLPALVIAWDPVGQAASWFVHPDIPVDPLVGMLEAVKAALVGSRSAQQKAADAILGPDGNPMRR